MEGWFARRILDTGRLPLFCFFVAFLLTFLFIRTSVRMIRAEVTWWPGNVTPGGMHIHHVVFGVVLMVIGGVAALAAPDHPVGIPAASAVVFGIGCALVLDEFALILHLEDVYWSQAGRLSVDAIFVAIGVTGLLIIGVTPPIATDVSGAVRLKGHAAAAGLVALTITLNFGLAAITVLKGKVWTGLFGLFLPILLYVGAIRVGRPRSPWARRFYATRPKRAAKSRRREIHYRRRFVKIKDRLQDALAGGPTAPRKQVAEPSEPPKLDA